MNGEDNHANVDATAHHNYDATTDVVTHIGKYN